MIRYWNGYLFCFLSSLERGAPNSNSCLLNQKLQMLNCCIEKKIARAEKENQKNAGNGDDDAVELDEGNLYS